MFGPEKNPRPSDSAAFEQLSEALRAGPKSKTWTELLEEMKTQTNHVEYRALLEMRRRLESMKFVAQTEPSDRLTRNILAAVDAERSGIRRQKIMLGVAAMAAVLALCIAGTVVYSMLQNSRPTFVLQTPPTHAKSTSSDAHIVRFEGTLPAGWKTIGTVPMKVTRGMRVAEAASLLANQFGGVVRTAELPKDKQFEVDLAIHYVGSSGVTPEVFITDADDFTSPPAGHELVWTMMNNQPHLTLPGVTASYGPTLTPDQQAGLCVNFKMNGQKFTAETGLDGKSFVCNGSANLNVNKPWHLGVRFVVQGGHCAQNVVLGAVKVCP